MAKLFDRTADTGSEQREGEPMLAFLAPDRGLHNRATLGVAATCIGLLYPVDQRGLTAPQN